MEKKYMGSGAAKRQLVENMGGPCSLWLLGASAVTFAAGLSGMLV